MGRDAPAGPATPHARQHWVAQLDRHAHDQPDAVALTYRGRHLTWSALAGRTCHLAGWLQAAGIGPGDRVAVATGNRPEFVETMLAASRLGAITVPINFRLTAPEISFILADSGARAILTDELTVGAVRETGLLPPERHLHAGAGDADGTVDHARAAAAAPPAELPDVPEHDPALVMYTSGTTGRPKGAVLTHQNLLAQSVTLISAWSMRPRGEVTMITSPLFHIGALGSLAPALLLGARTVLVPTGAFDADAVLDLIVTERITSMFLVPEQWQHLCAAVECRPRDLGSLRVAGWGAAPASETLLRRMASAFPSAEIVALFGQTEMSPVTCVLEGSDAIRKVDTVGRPAPQVQVRVVDDNMVDVPPGEVGEIVYRGPGTMSHYWNAPEATAEAFAGGWFHSGDLVSVDDEGFVRVRDRKKDMVISGGENIYCVEVENALSAHPEVVEVSVIARPDDTWGQIPVAVAVVRPGATLALEDLRDWASDSLARYKLPRALETVRSLPRNAAGKVDKQVLREQFGSALRR